jgi:MOSC domain-containing protein YiiM
LPYNRAVKNLHGVVAAVLVSTRQSALASGRRSAIALGFEGVEGDKHAGFTRAADARVPHYPRGTLIRNERQVSIVSEEDLATIASALDLDHVLPEWLGANLLVSGIEALTLLPPGMRMHFPSGAALVVTAENTPCAGPGRVLAEEFKRPKLRTQFAKAALHLRGVLAVVERPGHIATGDVITLSR